jgi:hypothetical protein
MGNVRTKLQPKRRLNSYNFGIGLDYGKTIGAIVFTNAAEAVRIIL